MTRTIEENAADEAAHAEQMARFERGEPFDSELAAYDEWRTDQWEADSNRLDEAKALLWRCLTVFNILPNQTIRETRTYDLAAEIDEFLEG